MILLASLRKLRMVPRAAFARPLRDDVPGLQPGGCLAFAALGNLGLIERERTLLLPFPSSSVSFHVVQGAAAPVPVGAASP